MARRRTVAAVAIRIGLQENKGQTSDNYAELLQEAFAIRKMVPVRGPEHMLMSTLEGRKPRDIRGTKSRTATSMEGVIAKFTDINLAGDWFNSETLKVVAPIDVKKEVTIPAGLKPNYSAFFFEFFPDVHTFIVQTYGPGVQLSPRTALKFFSSLFQDADITVKWGPVSTSLIQHQAALNEMFGMKVLKHLTLSFEPPNADDHKKWEKAFQKKMAEEKLKRIEVNLAAQAGQSITPTDETKAQAKAALQMGEVRASGRDENGAAKTVSSLDYPDREAAKYDPDEQTEKQAFRKVTDQLVKRTRLDA